MNRARLLRRLPWLILALLLLAEPLAHHHAYFGLDGWFGFNPLYALLANGVLAGLALLAGPLLRRKEGP
ncbi:MAG TPA: hypothetical protein VNN09_07700 [Candidatus Competibacteraceae bacterium]|nr:hypothetical protein [Candidatus Competibacteraceae bacterium]